MTERRNLISRSEGAGHPFRRMLAPAMLMVEFDEQKKAGWTSEDTHLFLLSFVAFFVCFYTFIF